MTEKAAEANEEKMRFFTNVSHEFRTPITLMLLSVEELLKEGATVAAFDPEAMKNTRNQIGEKIEFSNTQYDALENADALIIATEWNEFRTPDFSRIASTLKNKVIFDGRNLFDLGQIESLGFHYESVGRRKIEMPDMKVTAPSAFQI
ncbi:MAG: hypothetical protein EOO01_07720 [Chitinophagaceae bacterium]|nr:MAG: hypothetical protein EOO01_07720 [Chitinophagaceae bacterium]